MYERKLRECDQCVQSFLSGDEMYNSSTFVTHAVIATPALLDGHRWNSWSESFSANGLIFMRPNAELDNSSDEDTGFLALEGCCEGL